MLHAATEFAKKAGKAAVTLTAMTAIALPLVFGGAAQAEPGDGITVADVANMPRNEALAYIVRSSAPYALDIGQKGGQSVFGCLNEAFGGTTLQRNASGQIIVPKGVEFTHAATRFYTDAGHGSQMADDVVADTVKVWANKKCGATPASYSPR